MIELIKYELDGTIIDKNDVELDLIDNILGMKVRCTYKNDKVKVGYLSINADYYKNNRKNLSNYLELWTLKNFDKTRPLDHYDQEFKKLETKNLIKIEAILHSNPRWGTLPSNDFEFYKKNDKNVCPRCGNKLVEIVYGMPSPEMFEKAEKKEVKLGGCTISDNEPKYYCYNCDEDILDDNDNIDIPPFLKKKLNEESLKFKELIDKYEGKEIIITCDNGKKIQGILISYQRPEDNEEECWSITVIHNDSIYKILQNEIKDISLVDSNSNKFKYIYVEYLDSLGDRMYCYTSIEDFEPGDIVIVPRGYNDVEVYAKVITTKYYNSGEEPYPAIELKEIYSKVDKDAIDIKKYKNDATAEYDLDYEDDEYIETINPHLLFRYELKDAWGFDIWKIRIYDHDKDNIVIDDIENDANACITIQHDDLCDILNVLNNNFSIMNIKNEIVHPDILDGSKEEIYINIEGMTNKVSCYNLWAYRDDENKSEDAKLCLNLIDDLNKVLKRYELKIIMNEE